MKFFSYFRRYVSTLPILLLFGIGLFISLNNINIGTFLSGWDTLHPEFNLKLYSERVVFGAWQEHQGLGAPASQAHLAELPRLPFLWLFTKILPLWAVRYVVFFSLYIVGGVGSYVFIRFAWFEDKKSSLYSWAAFLGSLFYLLNLATLQQFYVPLEMFAVHFATFGFLLWSLYKALKYGGYKKFFVFFLIQFFTSPSAHTATLLYMYNIVLFLYGFFLVFEIHKQNLKRGVLRIFLAGLLFLVAHFYWMGPNIYYIFDHSDYVKEAKISRLFSDEAFWQNQSFGNIKDVLIFKNFLFNWKDFNFDKGVFIDLLDEWETHLYQNFGVYFFYLLSFMAIGGIVLSFKSQKTRKNLNVVPFFILFFIGFFFLVNLNFPFALFFGWLRNNVGVFEEALRFPFTKFSIVFSFAVSVYLANFCAWSLNRAQDMSQNKNLSLLFVILVGGLILYSNLPALKGNLVSDSMKVQYPDYYFDLFRWADRQPRQTRIAKFPINDFFGWTYQDWSTSGYDNGYQGAGFIWFGLPQPILDREFDRWVVTDESFYHEIHTAIQDDNQDTFNRVLEKYEVDWLLYDNSTIKLGGFTPEEYKLQFLNLLSDNHFISKEEDFGEVEIYKIQKKNEGWISSSPAVSVKADTRKVNYDEIYKNLGNYVEEGNSKIEYPFVSLQSEKLDVNTSEDGKIIVGVKDKNFDSIMIPSWSKNSKVVNVELFYEINQEDTSANIRFVPVFPEIYVDSEKKDLSESIILVSKKISDDIDPENSYLLEINDEIVDLSDVQNGQFLGSFSLLLDSDTPLRLYENTIVYQQNVINDSNEIRQTNCAQKVLPNLNRKDGKIILQSGGDEPDKCVVTSEPFVIEKSGLVELIFTHSSRSNEVIANVCLLDNLLYQKCLNKKLSNEILSFPKASRNAVFAFVNNGPVFPRLGIRDKDEKEIAFEDVQLSLRPLISETTLTKKEKEGLAIKEQVIDTKNASNIEVKQSEDSASYIDFSQKPFVKNCNNEIGKVEVVYDSNSYVFSASDKAIACNSFLFPSLKKDHEYIAHFTSENILGRPMKFYLKEREKDYNFLEEIAEKNGSDYFYGVSDNRKNDGIDASVETISFGSIMTSNRLSQIRFSYFPLKWVSQIQLLHGGESPDVFNNVRVMEQQRIRSYLYTASLESKSERGIFSLSQSHDPAWLAFSLRSGISEDSFFYQLAQFFPWPFGTKLEHLKYNNWANAWLVPEGEHQIIIIYWPQLLSFLGYGLLGATFVGFGVQSLKENGKRKRSE